ncbi:hypothetical protein MAUB1S_11323 [Mycolicibacterium aubagnense]
MNDETRSATAAAQNNGTYHDIWKDDLLGRRDDARFITDFIRGQIELRRKSGRVASYVLNVDSPWGGGKSFFLSRLAEQLRAEGHLVAEVNAWRDDHSDDPLIALMSAIEKVLKPYVQKPGRIATAWKQAKTNGVRIAGKAVVAAAKTAFKRYVGENLEDLFAPAEEAKQADEQKPVADKVINDVIGDALEEATKEISSLTDRAADALIAKFDTTSNSIVGFKANLSEITQVLAKGDKARTPLFVLVDELDRCRPTYAISLLERAKHLFEADGVAFVFATDAGQLQHAVRGVYGGEFDGRGYLTRFFDRRYVFAQPDVFEFAASRLSGMDFRKVLVGFDDIEPLDMFLVNGFRALQPMPLRAVEQIIDIMVATVSAWTPKLPLDAASLLLMSACYHQRQDFNLETFVQPYKWQLTVRSRYQEREGKVDIISTTLALLERAANLRNAVTQGGGDSLSHRHIGSYLGQEFNARPKHQSGPSALLSLPTLIQSAGRVQNDDI